MPNPCNAGSQLSKIIKKACAYDPTERYVTAKSLLQDLEDVLKDLDNDADGKNNEEVGLIPETWRKKDLDNGGNETLPQPGCGDGEKKGNKNTKIIIIFLACFTILLGIIFKIKINNNIVMPNVVGMNEEDAKNNIETLGLIVSDIDYDYSDSVDKMKVIDQSVTPDQKVQKGDEIKLTISKGNQIKVPDVTGKSKDIAKKELENNHLRSKIIKEEYSYETDAGKVVNQNPIADELVDEDSFVSLVISKGVKMITVPDMVGLTEEEAMTTLTDLGLNGNATKKYSSTVPYGRVVSQDVDKGEEVEVETSINIVISAGVEPEQVIQGAPTTNGAGGF